ncbi:transcriptional regulator [Secundilactobacillus kimchicus]|nr:transcriptional regulator [Secundilactobacillus kimchicus]
MKRSTIRKVEDILRDYPKLDKYIEQREAELRYPTSQQDDNVGGGKSNYRDPDTLTRILITIDEDKRLNSLKHQRDVIDDLLDESGPDTLTIIKELYFKKYPQFTLRGLVEQNLINVSRSTAYDLRNRFVSDCAKGLGLFDI